MSNELHAIRLQAADALEAAMTILPTRLYTPARQVVKALRHQATEGAEPIPAELLSDMAAKLQEGAPTVSHHLAAKLTQAAALLDPQ